MLLHHMKPFNSISNLSGSNRPEVFCKKGILRNFAKFLEKTPVPE